jgi:hypothetical protein
MSTDEREPTVPPISTSSISEWIENPYPIWDALRSKCPGARSATVPLVLGAVE